MTRTWTKAETANKSLIWESDDGRATVAVVKVQGGWKVEMSEDGQWIGSEPVNPTRGDAGRIARRWVRALSRLIEA